MVSKTTILIFQIFYIFIELSRAKAQTWIKAGYYWPAQKQFPVSDIDSSLFTHLIWGFAELDSTSYQLSLLPSDEKYISTFTETVKRKNPSVITLLSIGGYANYSTFSSMVSNSSYRKSFIDSSITTARHYGFEGLDFYWYDPRTASDMSNLPILFEEWRAAINSEARNSSKSQLILTAVLNHAPESYSEAYPVDSIQQYLNWTHVVTVGYSIPTSTTTMNFTAAPSALFNPTNMNSCTDTSISKWIDAGLSPDKSVMCLPYYGYAWKLVNSADNGIGAPATGPAISKYGDVVYDDIKKYIKRFKANIMYNSTYVVNYCTIGTSWIGFDDVEAIRTKVSYAREKSLLGYFVWVVNYDHNWMLSHAAAEQDAAISPAPQDATIPPAPQDATVPPAPQDATIAPAQEDNKSEQNMRPYPFLGIILPTTAVVIHILGLVC